MPTPNTTSNTSGKKQVVDDKPASGEVTPVEKSKNLLPLTSRSDDFGDRLVPKDPTEHGLSQKAIRMKRALASQPKTTILIPKEKSDPEGAVAFFGLNSYRFYVKKGEVVEVPQQIAEMYFESLGVESNVLRAHEKNLANQSSEGTREALNL